MRKKQIILCKDCGHKKTDSCPPGRIWCKKLSHYMPVDGFCNFGVKPKKQPPAEITANAEKALAQIGAAAHGGPNNAGN